MAMKPSQLLDTHRDTIRHIVELHKGLNPRVFGSVLHGTDTEKSDLNLLIDGSESMTYFDLCPMQKKLLDLLGIPVDLMTPGSLRAPWKDGVIAEARPI